MIDYIRESCRDFQEVFELEEHCLSFWVIMYDVYYKNFVNKCSLKNKIIIDFHLIMQINGIYIYFFYKKKNKFPNPFYNYNNITTNVSPLQEEIYD